MRAYVSHRHFNALQSVEWHFFGVIFWLFHGQPNPKKNDDDNNNQCTHMIILQFNDIDSPEYRNWFFVQWFVKSGTLSFHFYFFLFFAIASINFQTWHICITNNNRSATDNASRLLHHWWHCYRDELKIMMNLLIEKKRRNK